MPGAKIASRFRAATRRERKPRQPSSLQGVDIQTAARIEALIEQLSLPGTRIVVDTAVFRDAVVVVVRSDRGDLLDIRQEAILGEHTTTWSSIGSKDGRTVCFELARSV